jgi:hypothetical protein
VRFSNPAPSGIDGRVGDEIAAAPRSGAPRRRPQCEREFARHPVAGARTLGAGRAALAAAPTFSPPALMLRANESR